MIRLASQETCTGCSACANICPKSAIKMQMDKEGFLFPLIDASLCVECGKCMNACPILNVMNSRNLSEPEAYALWSLIDRRYSSSGGAFSAFARMILDRCGVVYGAELDESLTCKHTYIQDVADLGKLRGSKYVQSEIGTSFQTCLSHLKQGKNVLFTGTPCQVAGLYLFLGKEYDNLLTVDLACHGVPSNLIFKSYIRKLQLKYKENIKGFFFRKLDGWGFTPSVKLSEKVKPLYGVDNLYMAAFDKAAIFRKSCYTCPFAKIPRIGDCSIADFWGIGRYGMPFNHNTSKGVSLVLVNTEKGRKALCSLTDIFKERRTLKEALYENGNLVNPSNKNSSRDEIISDMLNPLLSFDDIDKKYHIVDKSLKRKVKEFSIKLHVYDLVKNVYNIIRSR